MGSAWARVRQALAVLCIALATAACGSGHSQSSSTTKQANQPQSAQSISQVTARSPITQRVLHNGELAGMNPQSPPVAEPGAAVWVSGLGLSISAQNAEEARLRRLGFVAGVAENLLFPGNPNRYGLSLVEQFRSASSAKAELGHGAGNSPGVKWTYFAVAGIPGARGFETIGKGTSGRNVAFADGRFYYVVGAGWNAPASNVVSRTTLIAAALALYHRVHAGG